MLLSTSMVAMSRSFVRSRRFGGSAADSHPANPPTMPVIETLRHPFATAKIVVWPATCSMGRAHNSDPEPRHLLRRHAARLPASRRALRPQRRQKMSSCSCSSLARLGRRTGPIRSQIVRVIPIKQVLPDEPTRASINQRRDSPSIMGWRSWDTGPYNATGRITNVLAINNGTCPPGAPSEEPNQ